MRAARIIGWRDDEGSDERSGRRDAGDDGGWLHAGGHALRSQYRAPDDLGHDCRDRPGPGERPALQRRQVPSAISGYAVAPARWGTGLIEVHGTARGAELWGLVVGPVPLPVG